MKLCLAGLNSIREGTYAILKDIPFILESFYYIRDYQIPLIHSAELFLLDSGAFTFMSNNKKGVDWNEYVDRYIEFINKHDVKYFFELDIDIVCASLISYVCSQSWDVWVFHKIRDMYISKHGSTDGGRWIWNNASTMTSQIIDTAIFITLAFWGKVPNIFTMIVSQYLIKFIYALCDTPFFYIMTNKGKTDGE